MITLIISRAKNGVIGSNGIMPWNYPEDMKFFKETTTGHVVIMGRTTWQSLKKKPLPHRTNIVISRIGTSKYIKSCCGALWVDNFIAALDLARIISETREVFVIGGLQVYKYALELGVVDRILLTEFHKEHEGDVYCPEFGNEWKWQHVKHTKDMNIFEGHKSLPPGKWLVGMTKGEK